MVIMSLDWTIRSVTGYVRLHGKTGYAGHSETERVLVIYEGLVNQRLLKIQSDPRGNSWESSGDEMNLHLPQSLAATAELKELMAVSNNIVSAQANKPVIGIVQDSLLAAWKMTGKDIFLTREQVANIVWNGKGRINNKKLPPPAILKPKKLWSGKQIFALLLPGSLHFDRKSSWCSPSNTKGFAFDDGEVIVRSGEIMSGQFCKKSLGASEGGIIHRLWLEYSPETAKNFISSLQFLVNYFIQNHGFSIGAGDTFIDKDAQVLVRQSIEDNITKVKQILHVSKGNENKVLFEKKINQILNNAMAQSGKFVQDKMTTKNNIHATVTAGSKGSAINLSQIMACVGQQNVNGQRIIEGYTDRPLPHFEKNDQSPEARGFVKHSYLDGLEAHEFFYHAMGGREGVIDTAVKSVTGDTEIVVMENGKILDMKIGEWIDGYLDAHPGDIERDASRPDFEFLRIDEKYDVYIPTGDEKGVVSWGRLTAVTRHDPTDVMYDIETCSGRKVTVADSESLLIWNGKAYIKKHSNMVEVGDCVPIVTHIPEPPQEVSHVDMNDYFPYHEISGNYEVVNDTVKDRIVKITKRVGENKMYDVTVPSTLNFMIKNGMIVRDTSDTGYTQRRLVKAMEDLMVEHDLSMRNSSRDIVQFTYGDDGYDGAMLITQNVYDDTPSPHACAAEKAFKRTTSLKSVKSPMLIDILCDKFKSSHTTLTHEEVYQRVHRLVEEIRPVSPVIRDQMYTGMSSKRIVDEYKIKPCDFDEMLDTVYHQHNKAKVSKGDMTGIIAAQSMGEVVTQLCLNTFHSAGISAKNVTLGVPRFKELINVAKQIKSPMMTLPLREEYTSHENIDFIAQKLEYVNIGCLISRKYMSGKRLPFTQAYLQLPFEQPVPVYYDKSIVFHFDMDALKRSGKTLYDIYNKLFKNYEDTLLPIYNHENDEPIMEILVVNEPDKNDIEIDDRYVFILMNKIMSKMTLDGDTEIKKTFVRRDDETNDWIIETDGLNLDFIFTLEYFKHAKCTTNHVVYVYEHFGIEAARNVLLQEIKNVIEFDGGYVNRRHFYILVDTMTHKGDIMPITRHGINKANTGPLMKCSFEETMDILTDAGMFSEKDNLNGVTENIIMGKLAPIGSGSCGVMFNAPTMDAIQEEPFDPASPEPSDGQYTDAYFDESITGGMEKLNMDDDGSMCTDTWFNDTHSVTTETYFPIEGH